jgi:hypothetical protein
VHQISPGQNENLHDDCDRKLEWWMVHVPLALHYQVDDIQHHRFLPAYIHNLFLSGATASPSCCGTSSLTFDSTIVCIRYRDLSVSSATTPLTIARKVYSQARGVAAATLLFKTVRNIKAHNQIMKCAGFM